MENCYFLINEKKEINVLCEKCKVEKFPENGWFWEGSKFGYGPFDFICHVCNHIIHKGEKEIEKN